MPIINDTRNILNAGVDSSGGALFGREDKTDATTNPTRYDDITANFEPGSIWVNLSTDHVFVCVDNSADNAVWKIVTLQINDQTANLTSTWSSHKINNEKANTNHDHNASIIITDTDNFTGNLLRSTEGDVQSALERIDQFNPTKINNAGPSDSTTYSSNKIESISNKIQSRIDALTDPTELINDFFPSGTSVYSSSKVSDMINDVPNSIINDNVSSISTVYSSNKVKQMITSLDIGNVSNLVDTNRSDIDANRNKINTNGLDIDANRNKIDTNRLDIDANRNKIDTNRLSIDANRDQIVETQRILHDKVNNLDIQVQENDTYAKNNIKSLGSSVGTNILNIQSNTADIQSITTSIQSNTASIQSNTTSIQSNTTDIQSITTRILNSLQGFPINKISYDIWNPRSLSRTVGNITVAVSSILPNYSGALSFSAPAAFDNITSGSQLGWISDGTFWPSYMTQYINGNVLTVQTSITTMENYTIHRTVVDGVETGKQWISIDCGESKTFLGFRLHFKDAGFVSNFKDYHVVGSNDNTSFTSLYHTTNEDYSNGRIIVKPFETTNSYRYYRIVVNSIKDGAFNVNRYCVLQEWELLQPFDLSAYASTDSVSSISTSNTSTRTDLDKLINVLNTWFQNGTIPWNGLSFSFDRIRDSW